MLAVTALSVLPVAFRAARLAPMTALRQE